MSSMSYRRLVEQHNILKEAHATLLRESLEVIGPLATGGQIVVLTLEQQQALQRFVEKHGGGR